MRNTLLAALLATSSLIAAPAANAAMSMDQHPFWKLTLNIESGANYSAQNGISSAMGAFGVIADHYEELGFVKQIVPDITVFDGAERWTKGHVFTPEACNLGVCSYQDLVSGSQASKNMQDQVAGYVAGKMWKHLESKPAVMATVGKSYNGINVTPGALLGGAWFLGEGGMETWARQGFPLSYIQNHDRLPGWLRENNMTSAQQFYDYLVKRMNRYQDIDISDVVNGEVPVPGSFGTTEEYIACEPDVSDEMFAEGALYVDSITAAAQSDELGYSQMQESFGEMSCVDLNFMTGLNFDFNLPSLADIGQMVRDMACDQIKTVTSTATQGFNDKIRSFAEAGTQKMSGFGPISSYGIETRATNEALGIDGSVNFGTMTQTDPVTGQKIGGGSGKPAVPENFRKGTETLGSNAQSAYSGLFN